MIDKLSLIAGIDIPFVEAGLIIHPPTIKELSYLTEEHFLLGLDLLNFSKSKLNLQGKNDLETQDDFDIFMTIMIEGQNDKELEMRVFSCLELLMLLFPSYTIQLSEQGIMLEKENETPKFISKMNYQEFKMLLSDIFCLKDTSQKEYNPQGAKARELVEKFKKRKTQLTKNKEHISFYDKIVTILAVDLGLSLNEVLSYTIYQIHYLFERAQKKDSWDMYIGAKIQGASGMDDVEHWMHDLFS